MCDRSVLRQKAAKRKELLAKSLGAASVDDLSALLGSSETRSRLKVNISDNGKPGNSDQAPSPAGSAGCQSDIQTFQGPLSEAFVIAKMCSDSPDKPVEEITKVVEEEFSSSAAFLKGTQSRNPHNDYSQNFVDTTQRPQNFIRDPGLDERFEEYPKLKELIRLKDNLVESTATPPMYMNCDLKTMQLGQIGARFDVILIEPTLPEYHNYYNMPQGRQAWNWDEIEALDIPAIAENRCFLWLWCGSTPQGTHRARQCLRKWGFRRCEDICWVKCNTSNPGKREYLDQDQAFIRTKEHCLMGIKGTVRRSSDGDFIHANVDIDLIITDEPSPDLDPRTKPDEMFLVAEHFCLGTRRIHLFGRDDTLRRGWVSVGPEITSTYFEPNNYKKLFDKPPGMTTGCTCEIESLRPKSPDRSANKNKQVNVADLNEGNRLGQNNAKSNIVQNSEIHRRKQANIPRKRDSEVKRKYAGTSQHNSLLSKHRKRWSGPSNLSVRRTGGNMQKMHKARVIGARGKHTPHPGGTSTSGGIRVEPGDNTNDRRGGQTSFARSVSHRAFPSALNRTHKQRQTESRRHQYNKPHRGSHSTR